MWKPTSRSHKAEPSYFVEHLATFRVGPQFGIQWPEDGIKKLKQMEKTSAVWAQKLILKFRQNLLVLEDENGKTVEKFPINLISEPYAYVSDNLQDAYNNLLIFNVSEPAVERKPGADFLAEMHIFQSPSVPAQEIADDMKQFIGGKQQPPPPQSLNKARREHGVPVPITPVAESTPLPVPPPPPSSTAYAYYNGHSSAGTMNRSRTMNRVGGGGGVVGGVNVRAEYENHRPYQPQHPAPPAQPPLLFPPPPLQDAARDRENYHESYESRTMTRKDAGGGGGASTIGAGDADAGLGYRDLSFQQQPRYVRTNLETASHGFDSDVNTLNCYFDDIERFVARVQSAIAAQREIDIMRRQRNSRRHYPGDGLLHLRAQLPSEAEFVDIFTKFKHCFNILGKLQHHIYEPSASELLHYLFSPLNVILDVSQWALNKFVAPQITYPSITREASLLLQRSLTQREYDIWNSLGEAWKHMPDVWNGTISSRYRPGVNPYPSLYRHQHKGILHHGYSTSDIDRLRSYDVDAESRHLAEKERYLREKEEMLSRLESRLNEEKESIRDTFEKISLNQDVVGPPPPRGTAYRSQSSQRGGFTGGGYSPAFQKQKAFYDDLKYKRAKIAFALHDRVGENPKELTITKGEYLEVLDDSRNWWQCRNINNRVGFVPHTILSTIYINNDSTAAAFAADLEPRRKLSLQQPISVTVPKPPPPPPPLTESEHSSAFYPRDNYSTRTPIADDRKYPGGVGYTDGRTIRRNDRY